jgi:DNA-binding MarR family transcriptional regulator
VARIVQAQAARTGEEGMEKPLHAVEFETMRLRKHSLATVPARREGGRLERSAYILLTRIRMEGPMSIRQLSDAFGLDPSTLNRQTAAMLRDGLVERIPDPEGGIARKFRITAEGRRVLVDERRQVISSLATIMADWTAGEVAEFAAYLRRFNTDIELLSGRPWPQA